MDQKIQALQIQTAAEGHSTIGLISPDISVRKQENLLNSSLCRAGKAWSMGGRLPKWFGYSLVETSGPLDPRLKIA